MFSGNWESSNLICVVGEQLPHTVVDNKGWQWLNEGTAVKPKWGFVSWQVGAALVLKVDTRASDGRQPHVKDAASSKGANAAAPAAAQLLAPAGASKQQQPPAAMAAAGEEEVEELAVPDMIVWVGYVKSWRNMGTASFNCIRGCKCQGTTVDALHDLGNTQQHMVKLYATEAAECLIEIKVSSALAGAGTVGVMSRLG
jgi:hypothetical protein